MAAAQSPPNIVHRVLRSMAELELVLVAFTTSRDIYVVIRDRDEQGREHGMQLEAVVEQHQIRDFLAECACEYPIEHLLRPRPQLAARHPLHQYSVLAIAQTEGISLFCVPDPER